MTARTIRSIRVIYHDTSRWEYSPPAIPYDKRVELARALADTAGHARGGVPPAKRHSYDHTAAESGAVRGWNACRAHILGSAVQRDAPLCEALSELRELSDAADALPQAPAKETWR